MEYKKKTMGSENKFLTVTDHVLSKTQHSIFVFYLRKRRWKITLRTPVDIFALVFKLVIERGVSTTVKIRTKIIQKT